MKKNLLINTISNKDNEIRVLEYKLIEKSEEAQELKHKLIEKSEEIEEGSKDLVSERQHMLGAIDNLEDEKAQVENENKELKSNYAYLEKRLNAMELKYNLLQDSYKKSKEKTSELSKALKSEENQQNTLSKEVKAREVQEKLKDEEIKALKNELKETKERNEDLVSERQHMLGTIDHLKDEKAQVEHENKKLKSNCADLEKEVMTSEAKYTLFKGIYKDDKSVEVLQINNDLHNVLELMESTKSIDNKKSYIAEDDRHVANNQSIETTEELKRSSEVLNYTSVKKIETSNCFISNNPVAYANINISNDNPPNEEVNSEGSRDTQNGNIGLSNVISLAHMLIGVGAATAIYISQKNSNSDNIAKPDDGSLAIEVIKYYINNSGMCKVESTIDKGVLENAKYICDMTDFISEHIKDLDTFDNDL